MSKIVYVGDSYEGRRVLFDRVAMEQATASRDKCQCCLPKFELLLEEQTPKVSPILDPPKWIRDNEIMLYEFFEFVRGMDNALGLSANQAGIVGGKRLGCRLFVRRLVGRKDKGFQMVFNPSIDKFHGESVAVREGCLTWPGKEIVVRRYLRIDVSYWDAFGEFVKLTDLDRLSSQIWQHELDHLNGVEEVFSSEVGTIVRDDDKIRRNDPCPCGRVSIDGKPVKYKKCCMQ
jgi:peptide deformylase